MIRTNFGRLPPDEKTPNSAYRQPILDCLRQMGDVGRAADVLECVERKLTGQLRDVDYELTATGKLRWRNAAEWERRAMVREGLLRADSPWGQMASLMTRFKDGQMTNRSFGAAGAETRA